jgi:hypothetical protein
MLSEFLVRVIRKLGSGMWYLVLGRVRYRVCENVVPRSTSWGFPYLSRLYAFFQQVREVMRFQVLLATSVKMAVFWCVAPCSVVANLRFRGAYCLHHGRQQLPSKRRSISTRLRGATSQKAAILIRKIKSSQWSLVSQYATHSELNRFQLNLKLRGLQ